METIGTTYNKQDFCGEETNKMNDSQYLYVNLNAQKTWIESTNDPVFNEPRLERIRGHNNWNALRKGRK